MADVSSALASSEACAGVGLEGLGSHSNLCPDENRCQPNFWPTECKKPDLLSLALKEEEKRVPGRITQGCSLVRTTNNAYGMWGERDKVTGRKEVFDEGQRAGCMWRERSH